MPNGTGDITFTIECRLALDGLIAIVLQLYRGDRPAISKNLLTLDRGSAPAALRICRSHLGELGIRERRSAAILRSISPSETRSTPANPRLH